MRFCLRLSILLAVLLAITGTVMAQSLLAPVLTKSFGAVSLAPGGKTTLIFTVTNPNPVPLTGITFSDTLPKGLAYDCPIVNGKPLCPLPPLGPIILCVVDPFDPNGSPPTFSINPKNPLDAGKQCSFGIDVSADGTATGPVVNTTSAVTSNEAPPGNPASATIFLGDPFQCSYAANLAAGDSFINITNAGSSGAGLQFGTTASTTGAICANVYAFTPDEQMVSCCSCPVTPDGLMKLSAKTDLASNTLTPAIPTAMVIALVATTPVAGSCTNSAASVSAATLANGMKAYATTIHATPVVGTYGVTEKPFSGCTLSAGELSRISQLCNFIISNGSGFGQCRSCSLGGLGANFQ